LETDSVQRKAHISSRKSIQITKTWPLSKWFQSFDQG
jgi:hypothetical protein